MGVAGKERIGASAIRCRVVIKPWVEIITPLNSIEPVVEATVLTVTCGSGNTCSAFRTSKRFLLNVNVYRVHYLPSSCRTLNTSNDVKRPFRSSTGRDQ